MKKQFKDKKKLAIIIGLASIIVVSIAATLVTMNLHNQKLESQKTAAEDSEKSERKVEEKAKEKEIENTKKYEADKEKNDKAEEVKQEEATSTNNGEVEENSSNDSFSESNEADSTSESTSSSSPSGSTQTYTPPAVQEESVSISGSVSKQETPTPQPEPEPVVETPTPIPQPTQTSGEPDATYKSQFKEGIIDAIVSAGGVYSSGLRSGNTASQGEPLWDDAYGQGQMTGMILSGDVGTSKFDVEVSWDGSSLWGKVYFN